MHLQTLKSTSAELPAGTVLPLRLADVEYRIDGQVLLRDVNLKLIAGGRTLILGPNGAGKSLLLRICHGLLAPTRGDISWLGPAGTTARARQAMVFQRPVMLRRSVRANVEYPLRVLGLRGAERRGRVAEALRAVGLESVARRDARVLSGGEQQRVALARAWVVNPEVLFLDEPTANLDPAATRAVEEIVTAFRAQSIKIVMTTHDLSQARRLADDVVFMSGGRVLEHRPAAEFFTAPSSPQAQAFLRGDLGSIAGFNSTDFASPQPRELIHA